MFAAPVATNNLYCRLTERVCDGRSYKNARLRLLIDPSEKVTEMPFGWRERRWGHVEVLPSLCSVWVLRGTTGENPFATGVVRALSVLTDYCHRCGVLFVCLLRVFVMFIIHYFSVFHLCCLISLYC